MLYKYYPYQGNLLFSQHKYEAAIERYTQAITLDPTNAVLPANRAMALLKMDRSVIIVDGLVY